MNFSATSVNRGVNTPFDWGTMNGSNLSVSKLVNPDGTIKETGTSDPYKLAAAILKSQFAEWESTYKPIEQSLINELSTKNAAILNTSVGSASNIAKDTAQTMSGVLNRQNTSRGLSMTGTQAAATNRMLNLNAAQNIASAENIARSNVRTQDEAILLGSTSNIGSLIDKNA